MGRPSILAALVGMLFVGSGALAQQGLVVDPWHRGARPVAAPAARLGPLPASGLPPPNAAAPAAVRRPEPAATQAPKADAKWSPPVVELLVDPWAKLDATAAPKPRWLPPTPEIIDPWASAAPAEPPRVASRPAERARATIF